MNVNDVKYMYEKLKEDIDKRISDFRNIWKNSTEEDLFLEIAFCILTPQSKAKNAWEAITELNKNKLIFKGSADDFKEILNIVRFKNKKSEYLVMLREFFTDDKGKINVREKLGNMDDIIEKRNWLVKNIKGIGLKEGSHILRNIGFGDKVTILDRHILKNLFKLNVIEEIPKSMTEKKYIEIENKMIKFCKEIKIPLDAMDIILWYNETGEIFK